MLRSLSRKNHDPRRQLRSRLRVEELESRTLLSAYTPAQVLNAYGINQISFNGGTVKGDGSGETIAIVDAYYDPTIQADLTAFSKNYGLPQLDGKSGDGTFVQDDLSNKTLSPAGDDWSVETALDVEWAHAVAPKANIVLVEAASDGQNARTGEPTDLLNAVKVAGNYPGVSVVSMSWGISEVPDETSWDSFFSKPGVTFVAASGDSGAGTIWPAVSPNVVSVGGTSLVLTRSNTIASETGWGNGDWSSYYGGSGGGFSSYETLPSFQSHITTTGGGYAYTQFNARLSPDVAYVADPNTGLNVYDGTDGGWVVVGGTSAGAPQWAALIAIADQGRTLAKATPLSSSQTLGDLYSASSSDFHDITQGSTGAYLVVNNRGRVVGEIPVTAKPGYDLVTGLGTPVANLLIPALAQAGTTATATATMPVTSTSHGSSSSGSSNSGHGSSHSNFVFFPGLPIIGLTVSANAGTANNTPSQSSATTAATSVKPAAPVVPPISAPAGLAASESDSGASSATPGPITGGDDSSDDDTPAGASASGADLESLATDDGDGD